MLSLARIVTLTAALFAIAAASTLAQTPSPPPQQQSQQSTSNISGRVTAGGKGLGGIVISLAPRDGRQRQGLARATTDADGRYFLTGVPPGRNALLINAPAYVSPQQNPGFGDFSKSLTIYPAETIEDVDFPLQRGAVITGRIIDAEGEPIPFGYINVAQLDKNGQKQPFQPRYLGWEMMQTDDRGIYRIYGLAPGRYKVSFGSSKEEGSLMYGQQQQWRGYFQRIFYPGTADENEAKIIELAEGDEAAEIDIKLGRREATFQASGRIVDAETNQPVPNMMVGVGTLADRRGGFGGVMFGQQSDANGEFRIQGLMPNKYGAFVESRDEESSEFYSERTRFEIIDQDVANVELKVRRGASISGVVVVENGGGKTTLAQLGPLTIFTQSVTPSESAMMRGSNRWARVGADGQFRISGLQPGKVRIMVSGGGRGGRGVSQQRIEHNGGDVREGVEVGAAEQITNLRIIVAQGSGTINAQVKVSGGTLPEDARMFINARRVGAGESTGEGEQTYGSDVDAKGRSMIEGVAAGDYELTLQVMMQPNSTGRMPQASQPQTQRVTVNEGTPTDVVFTYAPPTNQETPAP